jgi:hypothetical protein
VETRLSRDYHDLVAGVSRVLRSAEKTAPSPGTAPAFV